MTISFSYKSIKRPEGTEVRTPSIPILFSGKEKFETLALLDSGADISAMSRDVAEILGLDLSGEKDDRYRENARKLIDKIRKQYKIEGLHISYFGQNGLFSELLRNLWEKELTEKEISSEIEDFLNLIDNKAIFIYREDDVPTKIKEISTKIRAHSPEIFIISSMKSAMDPCKKIKEEISKELSTDYDIVEYSIDDSSKEIKLIYFLNRKIRID